MLVAERGDRRDFRGRAGHDDDVGRLAALQRVGAVRLPRLVVCLDEVGADDRVSAEMKVGVSMGGSGRSRGR